eukprot:gene40791-50477_t
MLAMLLTDHTLQVRGVIAMLMFGALSIFWTARADCQLQPGAQGLMMYGQMTAGSWIYIGSQGIVQGTYETYAELARQHFGGSLKGTLNVTAGLGGMGGAQPLAISMNEGVCLAAEMEEWRMDKRIETRYLDHTFTDMDAAIDAALEYK